MQKIILCFFLLGGVMISCRNTTHKKMTSGMQGHETYAEAKDWPSFPEGFIMGTPSGIGIDSHQNIFVFQRALQDSELTEEGLIKADAVLMIDHQTGRIRASWGSNQFKEPHGLTVDQGDHIWLTDVILQQVFKFSHEGQLLMSVGEKDVSGKDNKHFDRPTGVAVASDGSFYVSDGYGNSRIVKFSPKGEYLFEWGVKGQDRGEFDLPHAIALDKAGNVYVADRENKRIQMFDADGKFLNMWADPSFGSIQSVAVDKAGNTIFAVDYKVKGDDTPIGSDIIIIDIKSGKVQKIKHSENSNIPASRYHDVAVDDQGNIYTADILLNKIHRYNKTER